MQLLHDKIVLPVIYNKYSKSFYFTWLSDNKTINTSKYWGFMFAKEGEDVYVAKDSISIAT